MKVLVVDDEVNIRQSLQGMLEDDGNEVTTCATGEQAVTRVAEDGFDLLLLDVRLPGMDGLEVLKRVVELRPGLKVIMISGHADLEMAVKAAKLGAYNFFEKPLNPERVLLEVKNLRDRDRMEKEVSQLKELVDLDYQMVGESPAMQRLRAEIEKAAPSEGRILIFGENGTGKELVAREIHQKSKRSEKPFVKLNCAAIPRELIESELFGYEKGAFTGATRRKIGVFEEAEGGSLLLDEVGDMALETQAKLLRVLQESEFVKVGGTKAQRFDVRLISATNKNLVEEIRQGTFREDLYFRLNVIPIRVPPLRQRKEDIPLLVRHCLTIYSRRNGKKIKQMDELAWAPLFDYDWPGNIRELRNLVERLVIMTEGEVITQQAVLAALPEMGADFRRATEMTGVSAVHPEVSLRQRIEMFERDLLLQEFTRAQGNVSRTAANLKTDRANLHRKLKRYGIKVSMATG